MGLARGFVIISLLAVISSASASLMASPSAPIQDKQEPQQQRYYGPSKFA